MKKCNLLNSTLLALSSVLILGCAEQPSYQLAVSSQQIKQVQILNPNAAELNDGIIATLNGNYGQHVIKKYQRSVYSMKESRQMTQNTK
ncbi:hypothetical protein CMT41_04325 [Colwellia sp. MT41]|uniref:Lipoprotein n=1 Tax=Colwellia marinimaniae TaxID=1513592 RepID=A0ABQ0MR86_9GAMM|nr:MULTISPECIES: hypothetical protein [Colwellia]ALO34037.1 hypothetical protein CMT41_04325 [Colwellia sp. MT41]GAW94870.1 hypothetical protein MTCD1_00468 [Colwellia marinimaniae]